MNIVAPAIVKRYAKGTDSDVTDAMVVNALDRKGGGADDNDAQAGHLVAHTLRAEGFDASEDGTGRGTPLTVAPTLSTKNEPASRMDQAAREIGAVRRLTPSECEALQGFPRGWTLLEPETDWRKYPTPDGRRYAACGDAVTVNVAEWIGRRLLSTVIETQEVGS